LIYRSEPKKEQEKIKTKTDTAQKIGLVNSPWNQSWEGESRVRMICETGKF